MKMPKNKLIECACGCGDVFPKYDKHGRARKFSLGHNMKLKKNHLHIHLADTGNLGEDAKN